MASKGHRNVVEEPVRRVETSRGVYEVLVRRSARRRRTIQARMEDGRVLVFAPLHAVQGERQKIVALLERLLDHASREKISRSSRDDTWLLNRAKSLGERYFPGVVAPVSVRWVVNQQNRWASATPSRRTIRVSHRVATMPLWVIDAILVHELAHFIEANHGPRFKELVRRYPRMEEAEGFLTGVEYATSVERTQPLCLPSEESSSPDSGELFSLDVEEPGFSS